MQSVTLIASGDLRLSANQKCWAAQNRTEEAVTKAIESFGIEVKRGHPYIAAKQHGFIDSQKYGMEVFRQIPAEAPLVVVEAVWQYSHHVLSGLITHRGPILTVANWSGEWPGLVGHAEPEWLAHQSRSEVLHAVDRRFHRRVLPEPPEGMA